MKVINLTKIAAAMVLLGSVGAHAAVDPATQTTTPQNLVFAAESGAVALDISPEHNLVAGEVLGGKKLASVSITPTQSTDTIAIRFSPDSGVHVSFADTFRIKGTDDPNNTLTLQLTVDDENIWHTPNNSSDWINALKPGAMSTDINTMLDQTVAADTYNVSMDAAIWTA
ncbi:hypothetical protein [Serratia marcescens]|uniref:hypothetical protein n=1 Tax=Serratia marcescens TaxID=615 RepID=UPI00301CBD8A